MRQRQGAEAWEDEKKEMVAEASVLREQLQSLQSELQKLPNTKRHCSEVCTYAHVCVCVCVCVLPMTTGTCTLDMRKKGKDIRVRVAPLQLTPSLYQYQFMSGSVASLCFSYYTVN